MATVYKFSVAARGVGADGGSDGESREAEREGFIWIANNGISRTMGSGGYWNIQGDRCSVILMDGEMRSEALPLRCPGPKPRAPLPIAPHQIRAIPFFRSSAPSSPPPRALARSQLLFRSRRLLHPENSLRASSGPPPATANRQRSLLSSIRNSSQSSRVPIVVVLRSLSPSLVPLIISLSPHPSAPEDSFQIKTCVCQDGSSVLASRHSEMICRLDSDAATSCLV